MSRYVVIVPCSWLINSILIPYLQLGELETPTSTTQLLNNIDPIKDLGIALFEIKDIPAKVKVSLPGSAYLKAHKLFARSHFS